MEAEAKRLASQRGSHKERGQSSRRERQAAGATDGPGSVLPVDAGGRGALEGVEASLAAMRFFSGVAVVAGAPAAAVGQERPRPQQQRPNTGRGGGANRSLEAPRIGGDAGSSFQADGQVAVQQAMVQQGPPPPRQRQPKPASAKRAPVVIPDATVGGKRAPLVILDAAASSRRALVAVPDAAASVTAACPASPCRIPGMQCQGKGGGQRRRL